MTDRNAGNNALDISVVIPLYNKASYIRAALDSVLAQSHPAKEILVVDDGSTDDGPVIVASFPAQRIRLIRQANAGPGIARNRGIDESAAPWIAFLDADDVWLPDHLAHLVELHEAFPAASVLASGYAEFHGDVPKIAGSNHSAGARAVDFFGLDPAKPGLSSSTVAVRTEALREAGGFGDAFPGEDVDLWIRLGLDHPVVLSSKVTALYRREGEGLTHDHLLAAEPERPPIFVSLEAALADPRYQARHGLISRYRDRWLLLLARQALSRGNSASARQHLKDVTETSLAKTFLAALAIMPDGLIRQMIEVRRLIRKSSLQARNSAQ